MSVHAAYVVQGDLKKTITQFSQWGNCWAYFQHQTVRDYDHNAPAELHILVKSAHRMHRILDEFVKSKLFKELTDDKIFIYRFAPGDFNGQRLGAQGVNCEDFLHLQVDPSLESSRMITACRLITLIRDHNEVAGVAVEDYWMVPLVLNAKWTNGNAYSDSYITLYPTTVGGIKEVFKKGKDDGEDWDDWDDMYMSETCENIAEDWRHGANISVEMLGRILSRTREDFVGLTYQTNSVLKGGYYKDEQASEWLGDNSDDDIILTISAPVTDVMQDGETPINNLNLVQLLEKINHINK